MRSLAVLLLVGACGPSEAAPSVPDLATAVCDHALRCGYIGASQVTECKTTRRLTLVWGSPDMLGIDALLKEGRLKPSPADEKRCIAALGTAQCRDYAALQVCGIGHRPTAPTIAPGGACMRDDECIDGTCSALPACTGKCIAKKPLGAACGTMDRCTDGTFCEGGACRARGKAGETCGGHWQWCGEGLFCDGYRPAQRTRPAGTKEVLGTCRGPRGVGDSCATDEQNHCRADLYCAWGDPKATCQKPLAKGETCRWIDACADGLACTGLVLKGISADRMHYGVATPGRCAPILDAGDACDPNTFVSGCPKAMRCDAKTKRCRSAGHEGDPCVSSWITKEPPDGVPIQNDGCVSSNFCDATTRTCKKAIALGQRCTPQKLGVEDEPCFLSKCDAKTKRCAAQCKP